jgi:membrane protease subunit (stomatin/prohibitin family)
MGIFSFIKGQLIDVIAWDDQTRDTLVWRFPDENRDIKMGAQLTVSEGQAAVLVNEGKIADVYPPGRYELTTRNMPLLTVLKSWKYGFESPFKVDIYFISTREFANMRWGTKQPIPVSDPEFSLVQLRAFGTFNIRVADASVFLRNFAGTDRVVSTDELMEHFRSAVVTEFSGALKGSGKSLVEINSRTHELGGELLPRLQPEFSRIGVELVKFNVESVTLPPEIMEELNKQDLEIRKTRRAGTAQNEVELQNMLNKANLSQNIGDMNKFMQFQTAMGMQNMGSGGGTGGGGNDMMNMMMQMKMAEQMMQNMNLSGGQQPQAQPSAVPPAQPKQTKEEIMATLKELGELKAAGILSDDEFNEKKKELLSRL